MQPPERQFGINFDAQSAFTHFYTNLFYHSYPRARSAMSRDRRFHTRVQQEGKSERNKTSLHPKRPREFPASRVGTQRGTLSNGWCGRQKDKNQRQVRSL